MYYLLNENDRQGMWGRKANGVLNSDSWET